MFSVFWPILWAACWATTVVAAVLSLRSRRALRVGRIAVGVLMLGGGALFNALQLASGNDYSGFADPAPIRWIRSTWDAVVPPHALVLVGLLVLFEAAAGVLVLSGGRRAQAGYLAVVAFHLALWVFGWFETVYCLLMLPALLVLLRGERRAAPPPPGPRPQPQVRVGGGAR